MGMIILIALILLELAFLIWNIAQSDLHRKEKAVSAIAIFVIFVTLCLTGVVDWGFRYYIFGFALALQLIIAVVRLIKQDKPETAVKVIGKSLGRFVGKTILYTTALSLAIICPQFTEPEPTGQYNVLETKYTWTDESRAETFTATGESRKIFDKLSDADILVIASPVYFYGVSAQLKAMIDRFHSPERERIRINGLALLLVGADTIPNLFDSIKITVSAYT